MTERTRGSRRACQKVLTEATLTYPQNVRQRLTAFVGPPVMTQPRRPLSDKPSTDSCNIRFSLRTIYRRTAARQALEAVVAV